MTIPSACNWPHHAFALTNKRILAPMVRVGTLPMRLLALDYGCDFVYGPEIIDKRILASKRIVNCTQFPKPVQPSKPELRIKLLITLARLNTIDYVSPSGSVDFRCLPREKQKLIFQLGTADPDLAVQAALLVAQDVAYIDVNCGCPKWFSIHGGMGAKLLETPDLLISILTSLVSKTDTPITCKIRILPDLKDTMDLVEKIVGTGISGLIVHCRTRFMTTHDKGDWEVWQKIADRFGTVLPIIANGDIFQGRDIDKAMSIPGISSVVIARAAQSNPSIFAHPQPLTPIHEVINQYIRYAIKYDLLYQNTKYVLMQMYPSTGPEDVIGKQLAKAKSQKDIASVFGLADEYESIVTDVCNKEQLLKSSYDPKLIIPLPN